MVDIVRVSVGTESHASSGTTTPGTPAGAQVGDILVAEFLKGQTSDLTFPSGWALEQGLDLGGTVARMGVWWKRADGTEGSSITVTDSAGGGGQDKQLQIVAYRNCKSSGNPFDQDAGARSTNTFSSSTVTANDATPTVANSFMLFIGAQYDTGAAFSSFSGYSGSNPTPSEAIDTFFQGSTINTSIMLADGLKNDTTALGSRTATATSNLPGGAIILFLLPDTGSSVSGTIAVTLANVVSAISATTTVIGSMARTLANVTSSMSGTTTIIGSIGQTLANVVSAIAGTTTVLGSIARTLGNIAAAITGDAGAPNIVTSVYWFLRRRRGR